MPTNFSRSFRFAVGEVIRHLAPNLVPLAIEVALGLEDGAADEGVCSASHLNALLEADRGALDPELLDQKLAEARFDLVMTTPRSKVAQQFDGCFPALTHCLPRSVGYLER